MNYCGGTKQINKVVQFSAIALHSLCNRSPIRSLDNTISDLYYGLVIKNQLLAVWFVFV